MKQNLGIDIEQLDNEVDNQSVRGSVQGSVRSSNSVENKMHRREFNSTTWMNDGNKGKKMIPVKLEELNIKPEIMEALYFHKNLIISEFKKRVS